MVTDCSKHRLVMCQGPFCALHAARKRTHGISNNLMTLSATSLGLQIGKLRHSTDQ